MPILGCFIMPHGKEILNPSKEDERIRDLSRSLHESCVEVSRRIRRLNPDLIFIANPHGYALQNLFSVYFSSYGLSDETSLDGESPEGLKALLDQEFSRELFHEIPNLEGITPSNGSETMRLRYGATIPMYFINGSGCGKEEEEGKLDVYQGKYCVLSFPQRIQKHVEMKEELLELGSNFFEIIEKSPKRIIIVLSADLSHLHSNPIGESPFGVKQEECNVFDGLIERWVLEQKSEILLDSASRLQPKVSACGYTLFVWFEGILQKLLKKDEYKVDSEIIHKPCAPRYFGMMVAQIIFEKRK